MNVLLADFGSTFVKCAVYDTAEKVYLRCEKVPFPSPCTDDGLRFEVSERDISKLVSSVLDIGKGSDCKRAYISVQMHGFLVRRRDGSVTNYISWRDRTGNTDLTDIDFISRGTSRKPNLPYLKLCGEDHTEEEYFTLGSYIAYILTGRNITHKTDGCASGFFCASTLLADDSLGLKLPEVTDKIIPVGCCDGITVFTPVGDHQASYMGSGADTEAYLINIGTATQISCLEAEPYRAEGCEARPYIKDGSLITVTGLTGGDKLSDSDAADTLREEIRQAISKLPHRSKAVLGGGGSPTVFKKLKSKLEAMCISCRACEGDIGTEGLRLMAEAHRMKIGTMLSEAAFTNFPIILKNAGIDFYIIDCEHGAFDFHTLSELITKSKLVGIKTIIRIGDARREYITKLCDMGASGFLLSMTGTASDIEAVVRYAKYSPIGKRGISTTRAHTLYNPPRLTDYMASANREMKIYAQIETAEGVSNIGSILKVNGVDGVFIGPNDLSDDLGCIGDNTPVKQCISQVAKAANTVGKPWGIITANRDLIDHSTVLGVNMISCGSELNMLIDGCKRLSEKFV